MVPFEIRPGVAVVQLASTLRNVDNKYTMEVCMSLYCTDVGTTSEIFQ